MTASNFDRCLAAVLAHEGGWSDDPRDPGSATNLGITLQVAQENRLDVDGDGDVDRQDLRKLTPKLAGKVYKAKYWNATHCDELPDGLDYAVFDCSVNMGPARARQYLQMACGVKTDGVIGPKTMAQVQILGARHLIYAIELLRKNFYHASPNYGVFGRGWIARLSRVTSQALMWA